MNKQKYRNPNAPREQTLPGIALSDILRRLSSDVSKLIGVTLEVPYEVNDAWILKEGPRLDKQLLRFLEHYPNYPDGSRRYYGYEQTYVSDESPFRVAANARIEWTGEETSDEDEAYHRLLQEFPAWLSPLLDAIFFCGDEDDNKKALGCLRQLLVFGYKSEQPTNDEQCSTAFKAFIDADSDMLTWRAWFKSRANRKHVLFNEARKIVARITANIDFKNVVCRHGPGSVYPPCLPSDKTAFYTYYDSIEEYYGWSDYFIALPSFWKDVMWDQDGRFVRSDRIIAKITAVPKDSRGPRIICVHPKEAIWLQMGLSKALTEAIENHPTTRGFISFKDQSVNGRLALQSSLDRAFCTMDLKEASDRVDSELVRHLFGDYQYKLLSCARAVQYVMPDGKLRDMNKWAPMGNGLTFPVESLVFYALAVAGIACKFGKGADKRVYVFGDDIVCPSQYTQAVSDAFAHAGLIVNEAKTFHNGFFRESCGIEAFKGFDVTPLRVKKGLKCRTCSNGVSLCDLAKRLRQRGYHLTATFLYEQVAKRFGSLPKSNNPDYSAIYEYQDVDLATLTRDVELFSERRRVRASIASGNTFWHSDWHQFGVRARSVRGSLMTPRKDEWFHLQDSLTRLGSSPEKTWNIVQPWERPSGRPLEVRYSERGLEYPRPYRERTYKGFIPHLSK